MEAYFYPDRKKEYLLYGAGGDGLKLLYGMKNKGYRLKGFIDKRASVLKMVHGEKVWDMETVKELRQEAESLVIIITTKNVFDHSEIADNLAEMGFSQCIFKPQPILKGYFDEELEKISRAHDGFLSDAGGFEPQKLMKVQGNYKVYTRDRFCIFEEKQEVLAWCPLELLFNYPKGDAYQNLNMPAFFPLINLYRLFLDGQAVKREETLADFYSYSSEWAFRNQVDVTEDLKAGWLTSRKQIFDRMQESIDYDKDFFSRNAPYVCRGEKGEFHMCSSGRNRVVFQTAKGWRHVPVRMNREDYEKWIHRDALEKISQYMEKKRKKKVFAPIGHPYLKDIQAENVDYYRLVCFPIGKYLVESMYRHARKRQDGYNITDLGRLEAEKQCNVIFCDLDDEGTCSRYLSMCGFHVKRGNGKGDCAFSALLDELFYQKPDDMGCISQGETFTLITDDPVLLDQEIKSENNKIEQIICVGFPERGDQDMEEYGYRRKCLLGTYFQLDGMKQTVVYRRS